MLDLYMVLIMAATFAVFYGFAAWCDRVVEEAEGDRKWFSYRSWPDSSSFTWSTRSFIRKSF